VVSRTKKKPYLPRNLSASPATKPLSAFFVAGTQRPVLLIQPGLGIPGAGRRNGSLEGTDGGKVDGVNQSLDDEAP